MLALPSTFKSVAEFIQGNQLLPHQREHLVKHGEPKLREFIYDNLNEQRKKWYDLLYKMSNEVESDEARIDMDELAKLAGILKKNILRDLKKLFPKGLNFEPKSSNDGCISPKGTGRPKVKYFLTLNQANEFLMTGTTDRCRELRQFFIELIDLTVQFDKMQHVYIVHREQLKSASQAIIETYYGKSGIALLHDSASAIDNGNGNGIVLKLASTTNLSESTTPSSILKFMETEQPNKVLDEVASNKDFEFTKENHAVVTHINDEDQGKLLLQVLCDIIKNARQAKVQDSTTRHLELQLQIEQVKLEQLRLVHKGPEPQVQQPQVNNIHEVDEYFVKQFVDVSLENTDESTTLCYVYARYVEWYTAQHGTAPVLTRAGFRNELGKYNIDIQHLYCKFPNQTVQLGLVNRSIPAEWTNFDTVVTILLSLAFTHVKIDSTLYIIHRMYLR